MKHRYLEITYSGGRPLAAYFYFDRLPEDASARSEPRGEGYVVDYAADGRPIGIEITAPSRFSVAGLNTILADLGQPPISAAEAGPLAA